MHVISILPAAFSKEHHTHWFEEECIYILSGQGIAWLGDHTRPLGLGDSIGCPINGRAHSMRATETEPLVCLVLGQRLDHDSTDYPNQQKWLYRSKGHWNLVECSHIQHPQR
ncbi:MAG: cupin domain-containing protein [Oscillatoriales cyanobacterium SM2_2_1]|nr:cupin domain-containing protein [Oscillatoriales cyanobacterium SM2_2_1]